MLFYVGKDHCHNVRLVIVVLILGTFRSEDEDDYEYEFSVMSMRIRFGGLHFFEVHMLRTENSCP